jgi:hypothetical protein
MMRTQFILSVVLAALLTCGLASALYAEGFGGNGGFGGGHNGHFGFDGNRLNRFFFPGAFGFDRGGTLFDLYLNGQIPVPPYFALHPPVYYNGIDYQRYGRTPFAYPYTWWQQFGYGYNQGPPPFSGMGPSTDCYECLVPEPVTIQNPYAKEQTAAADSKTGVKHNPFASSNKAGLNDWDLQLAIVENPYVKGRDTAAHDSDDPNGPIEVANPHIWQPPKLVQASP